MIVQICISLNNTKIRSSFFSFYFSGKINEDRLRELLITMGDRFTEDEVSSELTS